MTVRAWAVAFRPAARPRHVLAFGFDAHAGMWVVVDPCRHAIAVRALAPSAFDAWARVEVAGADVWRLDAAEATSVLSPGLWCVGVVKRLLGLRSGAFTPAGLRRDMRRAGAAQVVHERQGQGRPRGPAGEGGAAG